jgi:uncharacterized protein (UPF0335 family)
MTDIDENPRAVAGNNSGGVAADRLRNIIERIEGLTETRKEIGSDIRDIYAEAKSAGFDVKVLRLVVARRAREAAELEEQQALIETYEIALGR